MKRKFFISIIYLLLWGSLNATRSIYRPTDPLMPEIFTNWEGKNKIYYFKDSHLEESAIFQKFDYDHFMANLLPMGPIKYRNEDKTVNGKKLDKLAHNLVDELYEHKKNFSDFIVLKDNDFNFKSISGDLVLEFKDYPFVLKLFIETPETFVRPFSKGWQPACFFLMSGGVSRYLSGFTRIKNLEVSQRKINCHPYWSKKRIKFPYKAYGVYKYQTWFTLRGKNIGCHDQEIQLPSIYWVICHKIKKDKDKDISKEEYPNFALDLSNDIDNGLDPHDGNILIEEGTGDRVIIDTEHFPSMVGLKNRVKFTSYTQWYCSLSAMALEAQFCRHKRCRRAIQKQNKRAKHLT